MHTFQLKSDDASFALNMGGSVSKIAGAGAFNTTGFAPVLYFAFDS
jgi:hypothetical protein